MKTRILFTKIWKDSYFGNLTKSEKLVFIYLLTNELIGLTNVYECPDRNILFDLPITKKELDIIKTKFEEDLKFLFHNDYVYIVNGEKYNQYKGERNEVARNRELEMVGNEIMKVFQDRVSIGYHEVDNTSINNKSKIINNKSKIINSEIQKKEEKKIWTMEDLRNGNITIELQKDYTGIDIPKEVEKMIAYIDSRGKVYKDYLSFARGWILRDGAYKKTEEPNTGNGKRARVILE